MDKRGKLRLICGLLIGAGAVFACLSLISFNEADPGGGTYPPQEPVRNWCGIIGAYFSGFLVQHIGFASAGFAVGLAVFWAHTLVVGENRLDDALLQLAGSLLLVVTISALSALVGRGVHFPSTIGSIIASCCDLYFGMSGAYIVLALAAVLSLLMATDFLVVGPFMRMAVGTARFLRAFVARSVAGAPKLFKRRARPRADAVETPTPPPPPRPAPRPAPPARPVEPEPEVEFEPEEPAEETQLPLVAPRRRETPKKPSRQAASASEVRGYRFPSRGLLDPAAQTNADRDEYIQEKARVLTETLAEFGIKVEVVGIETGPVVTQYEVSLAPGIKVTRVLSLSDDIAMALKAPSVRIVAPIPGRDSIGVEVPNSSKSLVNLGGLIDEVPEKKVGRIPIYIGRDSKGAPLVADLAEMPHLLIAGTTGSGKSVCINTIVLSTLMFRHPDDVKFLLVDPKMVELASFHNLPHLICPVVTDIQKASAILDWACAEMDKRYEYLASVGVRHISRYNRLGPKGIRERLKVPDDEEIGFPDKMPYIVIIIDELADLMMVAAKDIETSITRLAQKSRAVGIHLVLATQRPSVDVITGLIKSNLPARISFKVFSKTDSRTILDQNGADKLLGQGDMLYLPPATARLVRAQGTYVSDEEIRNVTEFVKEQATPEYDEELVEWRKEKSGSGSQGPSSSDSGGDVLWDDAVRVVIENNRGSVSLLQRRLQIGYGRAARLIDQMAEQGILGPYQGSQAREVLYTIEQWDDMQRQARARSRP
jgi:S-DNA-T family DNA segregation ATPase FtsK/SpoIIIE